MLLQHLLATVLLFSHNADNVVFGAVHTFFTSGFVSPIIYALQFNDHEKQVKLLHKINGSGGHPWIAFSSDKKVLYGGVPGGWSSYKINSDYSLTHGRSVKLQGVCVSSSTSSRGTTWVVADPRPPHFVYGSPFTNCANVISINQNGLLDSVVQNITYPRASGIHGMAFDPEGTMLYSADTKAHGIWAHAIDRPSGLLRNISFTPLPGTGPRHVTAHPNGRWLYAVCETTSVLAVMAINKGRGADSNPLTFTGLTYNLLPNGFNSSHFRADEVQLSPDSSILYSTTRARLTSVLIQPRESSVLPKGPPAFSKRADTQNLGYVTAIKLVTGQDYEPSFTGTSAGTGYPVRQLFQEKTSTSGGSANSITPAPWQNDIFAITDTEVGLVDIWQVSGIANLHSSSTVGQGALTPAKGWWKDNNWSQTAKSLTDKVRRTEGDQDPIIAKVVATWKAPVSSTKAKSGLGIVADCCANAIWLD